MKLSNLVFVLTLISLPFAYSEPTTPSLLRLVKRVKEQALVMRGQEVDIGINPEFLLSTPACLMHIRNFQLSRHTYAMFHHGYDDYLFFIGKEVKDARSREPWHFEQVNLVTAQADHGGDYHLTQVKVGNGSLKDAFWTRVCAMRGTPDRDGQYHVRENNELYKFALFQPARDDGLPEIDYRWLGKGDLLPGSRYSIAETQRELVRDEKGELKERNAVMFVSLTGRENSVVRERHYPYQSWRQI